MSKRPQVRIWGIVDLFLLLAVVLMIARVDAVAAAEDGAEALAQLKEEKAALALSLKESESNSSGFKSALSGARSEAQLMHDALRDAQAANQKAENEREAAKAKTREVERILETFKSAAEGEFSEEEHIERYRRLRGMVDIVEVTLEDVSLVGIDEQSFIEAQYHLFEPNDAGETRPQEKRIAAALLLLRQHILSRKRERVLVMLGYRESAPNIRDFMRKRIVNALTSLAKEQDGLEITISHWFIRKQK